MNRSRLAALVLALCLLGVTAGAGGTAVGSDNATIFEVDPETNEAPPGETVHVGVTLTSDGGYGDVGVASSAVGVEYDPDVLALESVERGAWMAQGEETEIVTETEIDDETGYVWIEQTRDPHEGGATGQDRFATVTFTVDEDAAAGEYDLTLVDGSATLTNEWPQQVFLHDGTLVVDEDATVADAGAPEGYEQSTGEDDPVPGFGVGLGALAVGLCAVAGARFVGP